MIPHPLSIPNAGGRLPPWLTKSLGRPAAVQQLKARLDGLALHTVCAEARCPNLGECYSHGVATVMIMGDVCTRHCKFCAVASGRPLPLDTAEPAKTALWAARQKLRYVVITSVDRDDLPDLGACHFAQTIVQVKNQGITVEVLTPDFQGRSECLDQIISAGPGVFNHNLETVERLTPQVRSVAQYHLSLAVLNYVAHHASMPVKSGIMLGLGETHDEILQGLADLLDHGCSMLTLGQYLRPTLEHLPVHSYYTPEAFEYLKERALAMGFQAVASGPFVRSSYRADELANASLTEPNVFL